jgi:chromosome segregation and condensation protein ScpB
LIKLLKSSFIKQEGKLKNYQYYFTKCFLDVFLINKNNNFYVNLVKARPTKLNGKLNINDCLEEIEKKLN